MLRGEPIFINGDGSTSRDFCFIENVVQANILAALAPKEAKNRVYNVAVGDRTSLNDLFSIIKASLKNNGREYSLSPVYRDFRSGDVRHSQADISRAISCLGYSPDYKILDGIKKAMGWYINDTLKPKVIL